MNPEFALPISQDQIKDAKLYANRNEYLKENLNKQSSVLEVGTHAGDFAEHILKNYDPFSLHLIDVFKQEDFINNTGTNAGNKNIRFTPETHEQFVRNRFKDYPIVKIHLGMGYRFMVTIKLNRLEDFDFIYLDSNHSYLNVSKELYTAKNLLSPNGVIGINDYTRFNLFGKEDYENLEWEDVNLGVIQAVNHFLNANKDWYVKAFAFNENMNSDIYIARRLDS
jgi:hypothetical protein